MMALLGLRKGINLLPVFRPEAAKNIKIKEARVGSDAPPTAGNAEAEVLGAPGTQRQEQMNDLPAGDQGLSHDPSGSVMDLQGKGTTPYPGTRLQFHTQDVPRAGGRVDSDSGIVSDPAG